MVSATVNEATTFAYRGDGLRESRTVGMSTTTFTWDVNAGLPVILHDGSYYLYGFGLEAMEQSGDWHYFLADGLGSTMAIVDDAGTVQNSYTYDVYGEPSVTGSLQNEFDFAGQQTDGDTGLQYLRARYMDPETGVFLSRDPLAVMPSWLGSLHSYAAASPCTVTDDTGLKPGSNKERCSEIYNDIRAFIPFMEGKKENYRANLQHIPEWAEPGASLHGHRIGHRAAYAGYQTHLKENNCPIGMH